MIFNIMLTTVLSQSIPVTSVFGRSLEGIAGPNPAGGHGCLSLESVVCCQVEVSA